MDLTDNFITALYRYQTGEIIKDGSLVLNNCRKCVNMREIAGSCHIGCAKPDNTMTGNPHGVRNGWFIYPLNYDPVWMTSKCNNFQTKPTGDL